MSEEHIEPEGQVDEELAELDAELDIEEDELEAEIDTGEPEPEPQPLPEPEPLRVSRENRVIRGLRERYRQEQQERRRLQGMLLTQQRQPQQPQPDPYRQQLEAQQEQERLAQMMPHEAAAYVAQKEAQKLRQEMASTNVRTADQLDRMLFEQIVSRDGTAKRYAARVEQELASLRQQGMNFPREVILNNLVGQEVREKAAKAVDKQRRNGAARIGAQTTRPGTPRSNVPAGQRGGRRGGEESDEAFLARLKSVTVGEVW